MTARKARPAALFWAAAMGLLVFFALESALARRVGPDLFLPVADGAFLPWRTARLILSLAFCCVLSMTRRGRTLGVRLRALLDKNSGCWLVSGLMTALLLLWTLRVTVLSYMISDDVTILKAIARVPREGIEAVAHVFIHPLFGFLLGQLHRLDADGSWYFLFHMAVLLTGVWTVGRCVLVKARHRRWPPLTGCVIFALLYASVFMYTLAAVTFTLTSIVAGTAGAALLFCGDEIPSRTRRAASDAAGAVFLAVSILLRPKVGLGVLCFWAVSAGYRLIRLLLQKDRRTLRQAGLFALGAVMTAVLLLALQSWRPVKPDPEYDLAEHYRSLILDTYLDELTDEDFAAAGIPKELASPLRGWFFMDRRVNTESFMRIAEAYTARLASEGLSAEPSGPLGTLADLLKTTASLMGEDPLMDWLAALALALFFICGAVFLYRGWRYWPEMLTAACVLGGASLMVLALAYGKYMPTRSFSVAAYPAITLLALLALSGSEGSPAGRGRRTAAAVWGGAGAAASVLLCAICLGYVPHAAQALDRSDVFGAQWRMEAYARDNPDVTIINNAYDYVYDPLHSAAYPPNLTWWGACGVTAREDDRIYAEMFFRDDVQFLGDNYSSLLVLLQYLSAEYGPVQATVLDQLSPAIFVSDITLVDPGAGYTGWYEQNGVTYYFRDGHAVSGEQTIDGKSYTFVQPGVTSQLLATRSGEGLVWYADAYSLIKED